MTRSWHTAVHLPKYGISGSGRGCWDHAALVVRDRKTDVPYLLEGRPSGTTLRTYEERLMQGSNDEVVVLPLRGVERTPAQLARLDALLQAPRAAPADRPNRAPTAQAVWRRRRISR